MDESNYEDTFKHMAASIEMSDVLDKLNMRGSFALQVALLSADIFRAAEEAGLSTEMAAYMAKSYWDFEVNPAGMVVGQSYQVEGEL